MKRKWMALILAGILTVTAASCGRSDAGRAGGAESESVQTESEAASVDEELSIDESYESDEPLDEAVSSMLRGVNLSVDRATGAMNVERLEVSGGSEEDEESGWTIFVYLCGTDLETLYGVASEDLGEMLEATGDNIRYVVETGGTAEWSIEEMSNQANQRYLIKDGEMYLVDEVPASNMGAPETLADFLHWGVSNYRSDHMGLILWDHGGGSINGVCFDETADDDSLDLEELDIALYSCVSAMNRKFDFIGFDACLMGTVETANVLASYADYMVASQEIMPGSGYDYVEISRFIENNPNANGAEVGKSICDSFLASCEEEGQEESATQSVIDLSKVDKLLESFNSYAFSMYEAGKESSSLAEMVRGIMSSDNFGGNDETEGYTNMVDMGGIISAGEGFTKEAEAARKALDDAIVYSAEGSTHKGASGLSMYYPLCVQGSKELSFFSEICISPYYLSFIDRQNQSAVLGEGNDNYDESLWFDENGEWNSSLQEGNDAHWDYLDDYEQSGASPYITFAEGPQLDENGNFWFALDENGINNTSDVSALVYELSADGKDLIVLGETWDVVGDFDTGEFVDNFDGYWLSLPDGQNLSLYLVEATKEYILYTSPVNLNGEDTNLRLRQYIEDDSAGEVVIEGVWDGIDSNGSASREIQPLQTGDVIIPVYTAYGVEDDSEDVYHGWEYMVDSSTEVYYDQMESGDYYYAFSINDIYGDYLMTDMVQFSVGDDGVITFRKIE